MPQHWNYGIRARWATAEPEDVMEIEKVDEITLALLLSDHVEGQAWIASAEESYLWEVLDRLHESGQIYEPATKARSVMLTEEGAERSKRLFETHFAR